jgi:mycothione reductase
MKEYDVLVVGAGAGTHVVFSALARGLRVALVERKFFGGTCLNVGCVPSKMLIAPADRVMEIEESGRLGIRARTEGVDFPWLMDRMRERVRQGSGNLLGMLRQEKGLDIYEGEGRFVGDMTVEVDGERAKGRRVFIASGARPLVPPVEGMEKVKFLDNESVLGLRERPESLIIIGGGFVAVEYAHFFAAVGTKVTLIGRNARLVPGEEPEISDLLLRRLAERMEVRTGTEALSVGSEAGGVAVVARDVKSGEEAEHRATHLMVAAGRRSNADRLDVARTGVETDGRGFVKVNEYLETGRQNIWCLGDANGRHMFTHTAYKEAEVAWHNAENPGDKRPMDYSAAPHAVYTRPQIASVGLTEAEARKGRRVLVGLAKYSDSPKGKAMREEDGFVKAIADQKDRKILGCHIVGPYAPILIQEVVDLMARGGTTDDLLDAMHTHQALPEVVESAFENLKEAD